MERAEHPELAAFVWEGQPLSDWTRPLLAFDQEAHIRFANAAAATALGYSRSELLRFRCFEISPDLNPRNWQAILEPGQQNPFHFRKKNWRILVLRPQTVVCLASSEKFLVLTWEELDPAAGQGLLSHDLDHQEKLARLSHFTIQRAQDAMFWIKRSGAITHVNEAACSRLGYNRHELTSKSILDINPDLDPEKLETIFLQLREKGSILTESHHLHQSGEAIPVEISLNYIQFDGEEYSCSIVRDIRDRRRREAALRGAFREIQTLKERLEAENNYLKEEIQLGNEFGEIISQNEAMQGVLREVAQVAQAQSTVLVLGESGTGKELIARNLHRLSPRSDRPMIKVNCAALPAYLIESELFGHEKGAFTGALQRKMGRFELADKGTIFLDEIGELPLELQPKLLRVLQEGEFERLGGTQTLKVDVRVIAATNRNLEAEIEAGNFRQDLYYRLNVFPIHNPPLRDRLDDLPLLVRHFCKKMELKVGKTITSIPKRVLQQLGKYHFPGNIRELENIVERAVILSVNGKLDLQHWAPSSRKAPAATGSIETLEELNRNHIVKALKLTGWRVSGPTGAAILLGLKPTTLESRMKTLGISRSVEMG